MLQRAGRAPVWRPPAGKLGLQQNRQALGHFDKIVEHSGKMGLDQGIGGYIAHREDRSVVQEEAETVNPVVDRVEPGQQGRRLDGVGNDRGIDADPRRVAENGRPDFNGAIADTEVTRVVGLQVVNAGTARKAFCSRG